MQIKDFLNLVCEQIKYKPVRKEISEEIKSHIEERKKEYMLCGLAENDAETRAVEQMGSPEEIGKNLNKVHKPKLDWKLLIIILIVACFGVLVTLTRANNYVITDQTDIISKYIVCLLIGTILSIAIYFIDYRKISKYSIHLYIIASLFIILSLIAGIKYNGKPYLHIIFVSVSPAVISIPLFILAFIGFIQKIDKEKNVEVFGFKINIDILSLILLSIFSLILFMGIQSVTSTFIVGVIYLIISTVKLLKENRKYIIMLWAIPLLLGVIVISLYINSGYDLNRIWSSFNPEIDPDGNGYFGINQNLIINSAQLFGEADNTSNLITIFDEGTNFVLMSILAHYGWIITIGIIVAIILLNIKLIINAIKIKDIYGKLIIIGISCLFILQSALNILMNFNLGIKVDINIPLISYGGINLIINMMCLALVLSVYRKKDILVYEKCM